mmetsp:Transcript_10425/g.15934  ORF Transcript_10425/g.15934 Transcript_10425/m.15934 type:complete len:804 (-) Transcript_10425:137-2548(-)
MKDTATQNTVFVRFNPPSPEVNRWHLENFFSGIGPIKKCSVISSTDKNGLGYGFVKFVSIADARVATRKYNNSFLDINDKKYKLKVELATRPVASESLKRKIQTEAPKGTEKDVSDEILARRKRTSRVIIRNLSFYANEKHIKSTMEKEFGPVVEVTLPRVNDNLHRGFAFVTFLSSLDARKATDIRESPVEIKRRPVAIDFAVAKAIHQRTCSDDPKNFEDQRNMKEDKDVDLSSDGRDVDFENNHSTDSPDSGHSDNNSDDSISTGSDSLGCTTEELEVIGEDTENKDKKLVAEIDDDNGVTEKRTVFIRNLPFDVTRHDIFDLMRKFGHIESIHPVIDKKTHVFKGSAFCSFGKAESASNAVEAASSSGPLSKNEIQSRSEGLHFRGRRLLLDFAVDKETASTLTLDKRGGDKVTGKDRRCLYLNAEGYVAKQESGSPSVDSAAWESLPVSDQLKRQRALADKTSKLKSPLFFINSKRLSIRNLAKHVDEAQLKNLCVTATRRGLDSKLVNDEDQIANIRATGDLTTREVVKRIQDAKEQNEPIIPVFNEGNVKQFIPSVFIDRDFAPSQKEKGLSRGFGFVDFLNHIHALACLRELNNNVLYSSQYVAGGKRAFDIKNNISNKKKPTATDYISEDGKPLLPRLIVDFTVENKIKAQQQVSKRAKQQANRVKQQIQHEESQDVIQTKVKKSRGARQRERKRKRREEDTISSTKETKKDETSSITTRSIRSDGNTFPILNPKMTKTKAARTKKRKIASSEDQCFEDLVESYTSAFKTLTKPAARVNLEQKRLQVAEKRWYE